MKLAIFDLDHTLIPIDSSDLWIRWLTREAGLDPRDVAATLERLDREYNEGRLDIDEFMGFQLGMLARFPRRDLDRWRDSFVEQVIRPHVTRDAFDIVRAWHDAGAETMVCTATHSFVTRPISDLLGVDTLLASVPEEDEKGEFTGRMAAGPSYEEGKVKMVDEYIRAGRAAGRAYDGIAFFSD